MVVMVAVIGFMDCSLYQLFISLSRLACQSQRKSEASSKFFETSEPNQTKPSNYYFIRRKRVDITTSYILIVKVKAEME